MTAILFLAIWVGTYPVALYSPFKQEGVIISLQFVPRYGSVGDQGVVLDGGGMGEEVDIVRLMPRMPRINEFVLIGLGRPKYVVGCTSSMCLCKCSGRL